MIFQAAPGQLLTLRNVANLVPPYAPDAAYHGTSAALEFGIRVLNIPNLIVLGHGLCGGVRALLEGTPDPALEFISPWMSLARPALEGLPASATHEERQQHCERELVKVSLANLMSFPWIAERAASGALSLYGAWFDIRFGELLLLQPDGSYALPSR
jgi:carbonic anhydrase